ncbi:T9SS type A sorting domain-containing protein [Flavobacteriaceae bacterium]|nr:T9SS type A sorting domain-containing protein [Flavobacteriaceae bacterium]
MKQLYTLLLMLPAMLFAQTDIDFQSISSGLPGPSWTWTADQQNTSFDVVNNPYSTGINTSSTVGELTAAANSNAWALAFSDGIGSFTFDATNTTVKIMVYKTRVSPVEIKFEDAANSATNFSVTVENTSINAWEELTFDFYSAIGNTYSKIVIIPDNSTRTEANITYFDNITFTEGSAPPGPTAAATTPTENSTDVISVFSDAYTDVGAEFNPSWDTADVTEISVAGDAVKMYSNMTTAGIDFAAQDVSSLGSIKIDYWTEGAAFLKVKLVDYLDDGLWGTDNTNYEKEITHNIVDFSTWNTITINLSEFNLPVGKIGQILLTSDNSKNVYIDNIYFSSTTITVVVEPDPEPTTSAPTPPERAPENVSSILSPNYADHEFEEYQPTWGIGTLTDFFIGDDKMWKVDGFEKFAVADYNAPTFNINDMETFHLDIWTEGEVSTGDKIKLQLVSAAGAGAGNDIIIEDVVTIAGGSQWQTVEFDLTTVKGAKDWSEIIQVILMLNTTNQEVYYFDNMYFSKEPGAQGADASLSDLAIDGTSLSGFSGAKTDYSVALIDGTTTAPQITSATTTDTSATIAITQATTVPGDATVVVTAADGTTTETYTVSFFVGKPAAAPTAPTHDAANVISVYSDTYVSITADHNPDWGQATSVNTTYDAGDSNNLMLYSNFNYQGTILPVTDLSSMEYLHIDIWVAANETRTVKVSLIGGGETFQIVNTTPGSWNSVDIPLTSFSSNDLSIISQMKFDGQFAADGLTADTLVRSDIYLDNIYFYKSPTASINDLESNVNVYPNPVGNTLNVRAGVAIDTVSIFDLTGREVMRAAPNATAFSLDVADLNKGLYLVSVKAGEQELTTKLVK